MDESDGLLLAAAAHGDAEAFGRFYRRHEQRVLSYAIAHCANASDVADVVGETFLAALGSAGRFSDDGGDAVPWLFGIARRVLAAALKTLRAIDRELLQLVSGDGLSPAQAGAVLGMNPNTARVRLSRARARLRDALAGTEADAGTRSCAGSQADPHPEVPHA